MRACLGGTNARVRDDSRGREPIVDIAVVGAGPVGLTAALSLARAASELGLELSIEVLDRRPLPADGERPQLLVARAGDVARLDALGIDVDDVGLVAPLASRHGVDVGAGLAAAVEVEPAAIGLARPCEIEALPRQAPIALVPIARLQRALARLAGAAGVAIRTGVEVCRVRRHARAASIELASGPPLRARLVIVATGAAASAIEAPLARTARREPPIAMIAGIFAGSGAGSERGRWSRFELPVQPGVGRIRCTLLETPVESGAGTALLVDAADQASATAGQLRRCFDTAARHHRLGGDLLVEPRVFATGAHRLASIARGGDNRAPVIAAGDAARSGHVFAGLTAMVNIGQAVELAGALAPALAAIAAGRFADPQIARALDRCERSAARCADLLARVSRPHQSRRREAGWALAGVG